ncbi:MAG: PDZ domain-containing protein [Planctomycetes bacterium]|nr:PDZ domain-containing protein [Planctomycetota bacterium]
MSVRTLRHLSTVWACAAVCSACISFSSGALPSEPPPLAAMEEPAAFHAEPDDEAARQALPAGSFSGVVLGEARGSLDALLAEPEGLLVQSVVENSPADLAGLTEGDLIVGVFEQGALRELVWPSEWRKLELETPPGTELALLVDRAGVEVRTELVLVPRVRTAARDAAPRVREELRVGVVLRGATEVEARAVGLGPGGGAVIVGLTRESPWRRAGLHYGDLIVAVDGEPVAHPEVVLEAIRAAKDDARFVLAVARGDARREFTVRVSAREHELRRIAIPILFDYERQRGEKTTSVLLGLVRWRSTPAAWDLRVLWLFKFGGGDADRLEEVDA